MHPAIPFLAALAGPIVALPGLHPQYPTSINTAYSSSGTLPPVLNGTGTVSPFMAISFNASSKAPLPTGDVTETIITQAITKTTFVLTSTPVATLKDTTYYSTWLTTSFYTTTTYMTPELPAPTSAAAVTDVNTACAPAETVTLTVDSGSSSHLSSPAQTVTVTVASGGSSYSSSSLISSSEQEEPCPNCNTVAVTDIYGATTTILVPPVSQTSSVYPTVTVSTLPTSFAAGSSSIINPQSAAIQYLTPSMSTGYSTPSMPMGTGYSVPHILIGTGYPVTRMPMGTGYPTPNILLGTGISTPSMLMATGYPTPNILLGTGSSTPSVPMGTGYSVPKILMGSGYSISNMPMGTGYPTPNIFLGTGYSTPSAVLRTGYPEFIKSVTTGTGMPASSTYTISGPAQPTGTVVNLPVAPKKNFWGWA